MRLDYIHRGDVSSERFELVGAKPEGVWAGKTYHLTDPYQLGLYFYEVYDAATNKLLFSQGFCSVFGEWQTTAEAKEKTLRSRNQFAFLGQKQRLIL
jgi:hypothetical protein